MRKSSHAFIAPTSGWTPSTIPSFANRSTFNPSTRFSHALRQRCRSGAPHRGVAVRPLVLSGASTSDKSGDEGGKPSLPERADAIIIGAGIAGLCAGALLTAYGKRPLILESHSRPGGAAHGFEVRNAAGTFSFDTGPSFFCGLSSAPSLNPLRQALDAVGRGGGVNCKRYDYFVYHDMARGIDLRVYGEETRTLRAVREGASSAAANQLAELYAELRDVHAAMKVPSIALRGDWAGLVRVLSSRPAWLRQLGALLPFVGRLQGPFSNLVDRHVREPFARDLLDVECFLLSGLRANATIAAEMIFMYGERCGAPMEYPVGGARSLVNELASGISARGGHIACNAHVDEIIVRGGSAVGVRMRRGGREILTDSSVLSSASLWDMLLKLVPQASLPTSFRERALRDNVPVDSFMHLHVALPITRDELIATLSEGHHVFLLDAAAGVDTPGNTVMLSAPSMWSPHLAPPEWAVLHAYTLEPYTDWPAVRQQGRAHYERHKQLKAKPLFAAIESLIPDLHTRLEHPNAVCKIGSPLTHERFNRRYKGTYGSGIRAGVKQFLWPGDFPVRNIKICGGDSTFPGIGVPAAAASAMICVNEMFTVRQHKQVIDKVFPTDYDEKV